MIEGHSVKLVTSHDLVHIIQTVRYFTDRHIRDWSVKYSISEILTLILIIVQNFVMSSYLEVTFLEASYLSVF